MEPQEILSRLGSSTTREEMAELLAHPGTEEAHLIAVLRKRDLAAAAIEAIARNERWGHRHALRAAVVNHPKTPRTLALRLLSPLFWHQLLEVTRNIRVAMPIRLAAEKHLRDRLPELELGERISLARSAPPGLVPVLIEDEHPRVVEALLLNPRLREVEVLKLVENRQTSPEVLRGVAWNHRWSSRLPIKIALVRHPRTPVHLSLRLVSELPRRTIAELVSKRQLPQVIQVGAERILAGEKIARSRLR